MDYEIEIQYNDQDGVPDDSKVLEIMLKKLEIEDESYMFSRIVPGMGDMTYELETGLHKLTATLTVI